MLSKTTSSGFSRHQKWGFDLLSAPSDSRSTGTEIWSHHRAVRGQRPAVRAHWLMTIAGATQAGAVVVVVVVLSPRRTFPRLTEALFQNSWAHRDWGAERLEVSSFQEG